MHARVVTLKVTSETAAEAVRRYDESIENSKRTPGYKMGILLTNPDTGKGFSITLWETKEQVIGAQYGRVLRPADEDHGRRLGRASHPGGLRGQHLLQPRHLVPAPLLLQYPPDTLHCCVQVVLRVDHNVVEGFRGLHFFPCGLEPQVPVFRIHRSPLIYSLLKV